MKAEVVAEVAYSRRKQHQASLQYYCALNALQFRKRVAMLDPLLGYTQAQVGRTRLPVLVSNLSSAKSTGAGLLFLGPASKSHFGATPSVLTVFGQ